MRDEAIEQTMALCRRFEGLVLTPYLCSAGVPTIGYGATYYEDGRLVKLTDPPITKERAEALLRWHVEQVFLPRTLRLVPTIDNPGRWAALTDFAFNLGHGALRASTLRRVAMAGDWDDVPAQLGRWVYAGGKRLRGLVRRRQAEADLV